MRGISEPRHYIMAASRFFQIFGWVVSENGSVEEMINFDSPHSPHFQQISKVLIISF